MTDGGLYRLSRERRRGVAIRPIAAADAETVQRLASDPAVAATTTIPSPYPAGGAGEFIRRSLSQREAGTDFVFALVSRGRLVGVCALHGLGGEPVSAELGYWIGTPYWRRGYASSGAAQVVRWGFENLPAARFTAACLERNAASRRVLEKLGFEEANREPNTNPKWLPTDVVLRYEIHRERWEARRP